MPAQACTISGNALLDREAAALAQQGLQVGARDELHDDEGLALVQAEIVDGDDIGMGEVGRRPCFVLELAVEVRAVRLVFAQDLDGHVAVQQRVAGPVDQRHAAGTESLQQLVALVQAVGLLAARSSRRL